MGRYILAAWMGFAAGILFERGEMTKALVILAVLVPLVSWLLTDLTDTE